MNLHPSITPAFVAIITKAVNDNDTADLYDDFCDRHKDAHGIKARWIYGNTYTAEQWVQMFSHLAYDVDAACAREEESQKAFMERVASLGLTEWAERNNIRTEYDLMEYNYRESLRSAA